MVKKKLLRTILALTLSVSLVMPMAEVNMQEVMAASSHVETPEEWNGADDYVIYYDWGELETLEVYIGNYTKKVTLSQDAYTYDVDTYEITINGKKLFDAVGKYCGENEKIMWVINTRIYSSDSVTYTGEPHEQREPSVIDAPEEWNGVDDFVIHIDKGAGKYVVETIKDISFSWMGMSGGELSPYPFPTVDAENITYDADKGEIRIDGKTLLDKIGKYLATGNEITYRICNDTGSVHGTYFNYNGDGKFTYTGNACELHYPVVLGDVYETGDKDKAEFKKIEWNGVDDPVIPIDKGTGEYEMVSCHFLGSNKYGGCSWRLSSDSGYCTYDSSKGGVVINAAALYSLRKQCGKIRMDFTLANGEVFEGYVLDITAMDKAQADENGFVIINGDLADYLGESSEITIPETVTTIMPAALINLKEAKVTINGNRTVVVDGAFSKSYGTYSSLQELILNGTIKYIGYMDGQTDTATVNGIVSWMGFNDYEYDSQLFNTLIVNGDIAYIRDDNNRLKSKNTKIYCKENSNILRYAKENELNYEIIESQPDEPQIQSASNEFDGTEDLIFKLNNTSDIKEIKNVWLMLFDNVYADGGNILTSVQYVNNNLTNEFEYNPETGEVTLYKELVSKTYGYDYVSIGNTFLGHIVYIAQDGTEKHAFGDWHVKILGKSSDATAQYMYRLPDGKTNVSSSDMQDLIAQNETQDICITANDIAYTFARGTMKVVEGRDSYDFGAEVIKEYGMLVSPPFTEEEFAFRINYNYEGDLPAMTGITIPAGSQWVGKTLYYYEVTESGFYKYITSGVVDEAGNFTISQNHCSDYVALTKSPDEMLADNTSADKDKTDDKETDKTVNASKPTVSPAKLTLKETAGYDNAKSYTLVKGKKVVITTAVTPAKASQKIKAKANNKNVTVKVSGNKVTITAKKAGSSKVTISSDANASVKQVVKVTVVKKAVAAKSVKVQKKSLSIKRGKSAQINLKKINPSNTTDKVTYKLTKKAKGVKVDKYGKVTVSRSAKKKATATVTVKAGKKATVKITVK